MPIKINITRGFRGLELEEDHRLTRPCARLDSTWWALDTYPIGRGAKRARAALHR